MLQETPIANDLADADAIVAASTRAGSPVELAEQYYRRPMERIKAELLKAGLLGQVNVAYNDFMGHAYHGVSLIRSYIGFDDPIVRVNAVRPNFPVKPHFDSLGGPDYTNEQLLQLRPHPAARRRIHPGRRTGSRYPPSRARCDGTSRPPCASSI